MAESDNDESTNDERRGVLKAIVAGGSVVFIGGVAAPAVTVALAPVLSKTQGADRWVRVARLGDLKDGEPRRAPVFCETTDAFTRYGKENVGAVWLLRSRDEVRALSVTCPHLGCGVERGENGFGCPCHTSAFDASGKRVAGPAPRDMDPIETRIVGEGGDRVVEVRFKKFRQGIPEREEIG
ncbi:MAG TPA: ubiquinol-cytochrome c reductase iron-sulfur subunit [Polyangiaceae bacterium]|nr:ubiquinol-cytochrome c reductase iron-sulfur subunit [Polyangiaceae bacterium]